MSNRFLSLYSGISINGIIKPLFLLLGLLILTVSYADAQTNKYYNPNKSNETNKNPYYKGNETKKNPYYSGSKENNSKTNSNSKYKYTKKSADENQKNLEKERSQKEKDEKFKRSQNKKEQERLEKEKAKLEKEKAKQEKEQKKKEKEKEYVLKKEKTKKSIVQNDSSEFKRNYWVLFGYNHNLTPSDTMKNHYGPVYGTFGLDILKYLAFDFTIGGVFGEFMDKIRPVIHTHNDYMTHLEDKNYKSSITSVDFKPYIIGQYIFDFGVAKLRPYVGVGPSYHLVYTENKFDVGTETLYTHDLGVAVKAGLRVQLVEYLMIGINFEYLWHDSGIFYKDKERIDMSGVYLGAEIGVSF